MRSVRILVAIGLLGLAGLSSAAQTADVDCAAFLIGEWAGKGDFAGFGEKTELDNKYTFGADGAFKTLNRFRRDGGGWTKQQAEGRWSAAAGQGEGVCEVTMTSGDAGMSASSVSEYIRVDDDAFTTMDFRMDRVK